MSRSIFPIFLLFLFTVACDSVQYPQGKALYETNCSVCHMPDGSGVAKLYPALNNIPSEDIDIKTLPCIIRYGQNKEKYSLEMVGIGNLTDIEINNIINYMLNDLNGMKIEYQIDVTRSELNNCIETN